MFTSVCRDDSCPKIPYSNYICWILRRWNNLANTFFVYNLSDTVSPRSFSIYPKLCRVTHHTYNIYCCITPTSRYSYSFIRNHCFHLARTETLSLSSTSGYSKPRNQGTHFRVALHSTISGDHHPRIFVSSVPEQKHPVKLKSRCKVICSRLVYYLFGRNREYSASENTELSIIVSRVSRIIPPTGAINSAL